jgi:hypothetical protein
MFMTISNRLNTFLLVLLVLMAASIIAILATRSNAGPLDPTGPPSSTLPQVEPRSPIPPVGWDGVSAISVSSPGSYFLTQDLTAIPIIINAEDVTFDLNGFTLIGSGTPNDGISATAGVKRNIVVRNGSVVGWGHRGINLPQVGRSIFEGLHVSGCSQDGLLIGTGNVVADVDSHNNLQGIEVVLGVDWGGTIRDSVVSQNSGYGINLGGNNVFVRDTVIDGNVGSGVLITGSWNEVTNSESVGNGPFGVNVAGNRNVVVRDHIDGNTTAATHDSGAGNIIGPLYPLGSTTDPAGNIGF